MFIHFHFKKIFEKGRNSPQESSRRGWLALFSECKNLHVSGKLVRTAVKTDGRRVGGNEELHVWMMTESLVVTELKVSCTLTRQEGDQRKASAQWMLQKSTDFLRRIIAVNPKARRCHIDACVSSCPSNPTRRLHLAGSPKAATTRTERNGTVGDARLATTSTRDGTQQSLRYSRRYRSQ